MWPGATGEVNAVGVALWGHWNRRNRWGGSSGEGAAEPRCGKGSVFLQTALPAPVRSLGCSQALGHGYWVSCSEN